jgi:hypothetical protein
MRFPSKVRLISGLATLALVCTASCCLAAGHPPPLRRYRDLKVYTTSKPDKRHPNQIVARTQFVNEGPKPLRVAAQLSRCSAISFTGSRYSAAVKPGRIGIWIWRFVAPAKLAKRQILEGSIDINGARERDLFITVQGKDPADLKDDGLEKITEAARAVATYAPRSQSSIDAEMACRKSHQAKPFLTLASNGNTDYGIFLESDPATRDATIGDLQRVIRLQSGAEIRVITSEDEPICKSASDDVAQPGMASKSFHSGSDSPMRAIILRTADLGGAAKGLQDAYRLKTEGENIIVEAPTPEGLRSGVYGLLTDHLGAHWFQPNALGEEIAIPKDKTVRLPALNEVKGSVWTSCTGCSWGRSEVWDHRNRCVVNGGRMCFGHSWSGFINPNKYPFDKFPDYYARNPNGSIRMKTGDSNFCSTNPEVIDIVAKDVNAFFRNNQDAVVTSLDPNDMAPICLCDRCLALDKQLGQIKTTGYEVTDRLLYFSKQIYDRLEPQFKDRYLGILVYGQQIELPKSMKPHSRHAGIICDMSWVYDHSRPWNDPTSSLNKHFYDLIKGWGAMLAQFGYYDYYGQCVYFGPWGIVHKMREDLPAFHDLGGSFLVLENQPDFILQGMNHYISSKLVWDIDTDVDLALEEFFREYYGPAAPQMRGFWLTGERLFALERPSSNMYPRAAYRDGFWEALAPYLQKARKAVAHLPASQKRYTERVNMASEAFDYARGRFDYDRKFGWVANQVHIEVDHPAAIEYLRKYRSEFEEPQKKYSGDDGYYPPLQPGYFRTNIDEAIQAHQNNRAAMQGFPDAENMGGYSDAETFAEMRKTMTEIYDFQKDGWKFATDKSDIGIKNAWFRPSFNDARWRSIKIGEFWEQQGVDYDGLAWYRKTFTAPAVDAGKEILVAFGGADDLAKVWLNGVYVGEQHLEIGTGATTPFALDVTKVIKPGQANTLAVRVDDPGALGGLWKSIKIMVK